MTKLSSAPISQLDIEKYLNNYSDFSFELKVLKRFSDLGFSCCHSGTYEDPVTNKSREYDIRALLKMQFIRVHLSIECKNLRVNFPLVVHCLERKENESYNELIYTFEPKIPKQPVGPISLPLPAAFMEFSKSVRLEQFCLYPNKLFVAKSADQIGKRYDNSEITATNGEVFDKISQAINSSIDLISEAYYLDTDVFPAYLTFVCPVLVIPDGSLWQANYSDNGEQIGKPKLINHIPYYIGKEWTVGNGLQSLTYTISHLEIVTYSEIDTFVNKYLGDFIALYSNKISESEEL